MKRTEGKARHGAWARAALAFFLTAGVAASAFAGTTLVEDDDPSVVFGGIWFTASDSSLSGGSGHESNTVGSSATLVFYGTGVSWISYTCACEAGISNVYVDGKFVESVDTYSPTPQAQVPVFTIANLALGFHILTIEVTGQYDPQGQTAYVMVDAFDVVD